jgi:hypothetical protein
VLAMCTKVRKEGPNMMAHTGLLELGMEDDVSSGVSGKGTSPLSRRHKLLTLWVTSICIRNNLRAIIRVKILDSICLRLDYIGGVAM